MSLSSLAVGFGFLVKTCKLRVASIFLSLFCPAVSSVFPQKVSLGRNYLVVFSDERALVSSAFYTKTQPCWQRLDCSCWLNTQRLVLQDKDSPFLALSNFYGLNIPTRPAFKFPIRYHQIWVWKETHSDLEWYLSARWGSTIGCRGN